MPPEDDLFSSSQGLVILGKQGMEAPLHPCIYPLLPAFPLMEVLATLRDSSFKKRALLFSCRPLIVVHKYSTIDILIPYHMVRIGYGFIHFNMRKISILQVMLRSQY